MKNDVIELFLNLSSKEQSGFTCTSTKPPMFDLDTIKQLEIMLRTPYQVAQARKSSLLRNDGCNSEHSHHHEQGIGLPSIFVNHIIKPSIESFLSSLSYDINNDDYEVSLSSQLETKLLHRVLSFLSSICKLDVTLSEEIAKSGSHVHLSKIIYLDSSSIIDSKYQNHVSKGKENNDGNDDGISLSESKQSLQQRKEQDEDLLTEIQDLACEIVHDSRIPHLTFPVKVSPFTREELINRLPLEFHVQSPYYNNENSVVKKEMEDSSIIGSCAISERMSFLVQQVTDRQSAQEDVGFGTYGRHLIKRRRERKQIFCTHLLPPLFIKSHVAKCSRFE